MRNVFGSMCGNQIITEHFSSDKKYKVVVFVRSCGATTGFSTQISILRNDKALRDDESGNVLTLSDHYFGDYRNEFGGADVKVKWIESRKVMVQFDSKSELGKKEKEIKGIEVTYVEFQ